MTLSGFTPWPEELAKRYRREGYWSGVALGSLPERWARDHGDRVAVVDGERRVGYAELERRSAALAGALGALGLARGDRVVIQVGNTLGFCDLLLALLRLGALPVMALPAHRDHEIRHLVAHSRARALAMPGADPRHDYVPMARRLQAELPRLELLLLDGGAADGAHELATLVAAGAPAPTAEVGPEEVALFLLSGGTTGLPKLIPRTHDDYHYNARASARLCGLGGDTAYLAALPVSHNFPLACPGLLGTWMSGGRVVLTRDPSPAAALPLVEREGVTATALVPTLAQRWIDAAERAGAPPESLRLVQVGGARLAPEVARRLRPALGARLQQVFGMAEGLLSYTRLDDPETVVVETQGRPLSPADEIRIVDAEGTPVPDGTPGELLTRGPYTLRGYYDAAEHNRRAFTPDGFYRSGDVVVHDASGNLRVHGRAKDLINRGGEKISAEEVENLALADPRVLDAAAIAMPDPQLGERTCLYVTVREGTELTLEDVTGLMRRQRIATFKLPERLEVVAALPLTKVGKVDKRALREDVAAKLDAERGRA